MTIQPDDRSAETKLRNFTPLMDSVVQDCGTLSAVVFGAVWRYCQMQDGICRASLEHIAQRVGVDRRTVLRYIKDLCDKGYLEDTTPQVTNAPHVYRDTGKAGMRVVVEATGGVTNSHPAENGVTESHPCSDTESPLGVTESHPKILSKILSEDIRDGVPSQAAPGGAPKRPLSDKQREHNALRKQLTEHFEQKTGLQCPVKGSAKGIGSLWWNPVREMLEAYDWDIAAATRLMDDALARLEGMTVADPNSLLKTYRALRAEERRRGTLKTRAPDGVFILPAGGYSSRGGRNGR